jgi:hypothetical protein
MMAITKPGDSIHRVQALSTYHRAVGVRPRMFASAANSLTIPRSGSELSSFLPF